MIEHAGRAPSGLTVAGSVYNERKSSPPQLRRGAFSAKPTDPLRALTHPCKCSITKAL